MDRGAWQATVHGVERVRHNWVMKTFIFHPFLHTIKYTHFMKKNNFQWSYQIGLLSPRPTFRTFSSFQEDSLEHLQSLPVVTLSPRQPRNYPQKHFLSLLFFYCLCKLSRFYKRIEFWKQKWGILFKLLHITTCHSHKILRTNLANCLNCRKEREKEIKKKNIYSG